MNCNPLFSIVIPTCNRWDLLSLCLDNIASHKQSYALDKYEVIVSNDGKIDGFREVQKLYPWVKFVQGPRKGPAANRNNGAKHAKGDWLVFLDDDCVPDKDLLSRYENLISQYKNTKVFEGRIYVDVPKYSLGITTPVNLTGGYLWACNFSIQRDLFILLNGFDEQFPYPAMEDVDLKTRIDKVGEKIVFASEASVCHPWRKKGGWKKVMQHNDSTFIYLNKHPYERTRINAMYYLKVNMRAFLFDTAPGIFKYKGKGFSLEMVEHVGLFWMAVQLLFKKR